MKFSDVHLDPNSYLAPNCTLVGTVFVGSGSSIFSGVCARGDRAPITIGTNSNIQENAILHVDYDLPCTIGDNVTIGHGAIVHCATICDNTIIGMGATVLDGAVIGKNCVVGAGAVISKGSIIPDESIVVGIPGKVKKAISDEQKAYNQTSADDYQENARELVDAGFFLKGSEVPLDHPTIALSHS